MNFRSLTIMASAVVLAPLQLLSACSDPQAASDSVVDVATPAPLEDAPLEPFQERLLDLAYEAASAMPLAPHVKNRSRAQESVVVTCLELDQPRRAARYIEGIENWRRGAAYADLAYYCALNGSAAEVEPFLERALEVAETSEDARKQKWRADRIRVKAARAHVLLGQEEQAALLEAGVELSESGVVDAARAALAGAEEFDHWIATIDGVVQTGNLDQVRNALAAGLELHRRFYEDEQSRSKVQERVKDAFPMIPVQVRVELLAGLAEGALEHEDQEAALELVELAQATVDEVRWTPLYEIPLEARLASLRHAAGDEANARKQADAALLLYDTKRESIQSFERAETIRPLAEAYWAMGERGTALELYRRAVEDGAENPNARPRTDDLTATCVSMALHGVEPGDQLWERLLEIQRGLGDPW